MNIMVILPMISNTAGCSEGTEQTTDEVPSHCFLYPQTHDTNAQ